MVGRKKRSAKRKVFKKSPRQRRISPYVRRGVYNTPKKSPRRRTYSSMARSAVRRSAGLGRSRMEETMRRSGTAWAMRHPEMAAKSRLAATRRIQKRQREWENVLSEVLGPQVPPADRELNAAILGIPEDL